jgi:hypothetical protein
VGYHPPPTTRRKPHLPSGLACLPGDTSRVRPRFIVGPRERAPTRVGARGVDADERTGRSARSRDERPQRARQPAEPPRTTERHEPLSGMATHSQRAYDASRGDLGHVGTDRLAGYTQRRVQEMTYRRTGAELAPNLPGVPRGFSVRTTESRFPFCDLWTF